MLLSQRQGLIQRRDGDSDLRQAPGNRLLKRLLAFHLSRKKQCYAKIAICALMPGKVALLRTALCPMRDAPCLKCYGRRPLPHHPGNRGGSSPIHGRSGPIDICCTRVHN